MYVTKVSGSSRPQPIRYCIKLGLRQYTIAFDVQQISNEETEEIQYVWSEAVFPKGTPTYGMVVSAIIHGRYSDNDMQAIINNHLLEDGNEEHEAEWSAMQEWRATAKSMAKQILEEIQK